MYSQRAPLTPDTLLGISIGAAIARHQYDHDPTVLMAEVTRLADGRGDILAQEAGRWAGYHEPDQESAAVVTALKQVPGADVWVQLGRDRRGAPPHGTAQFHPRTHENPGA